MNRSLKKLPYSWCAAQIGLLCSLKNGRAFKPSEWTTNGLPIIRIQNLNNPKASFNYFDGEFSDRYYLQGGELLFAWSGTPGTSFGAHVWKGGEAVLNQHIFRVDFSETMINKNFFRYAINQKLNELIDIAHGGVGLRHVTKGKFESTEIALAPFNEQKRIADKLDSILARVDACRERLDRIPVILKRFRQAILAAATSGKLTEEWREFANLPFKKSESSLCLFDIPENWIWTRILTIADVKGGKRLPKGAKLVKENTGFPYIKAGQLKKGSVSSEAQEYLTPDIQKIIKRYIVNSGDVYITIVGACIGDSGIIPHEYDKANLTENAAKLCNLKNILNKGLRKLSTYKSVLTF